MADHGIVIGIDSYPGIRDLQGPCNDARAFEQWLLSKHGGGLKRRNVEMLLTSHFPAPTGIEDAHPIEAELAGLFRPLIRRAVRREHTKGRLFIYLAGHGLADPQEIDSAALFAADAEPVSFPTHLAVVEYANFFRRTWAFDEVILIMDACRTTNILHQISKPPLPRVPPHPNAHKVKVFTAFAAGFGQVARERAFPGGTVRGIFTTALLDALENASPNARSRVNGSAIKRHVHNTIDSFAGEIQVPPPNIHAEESADVFFVTRKGAGVDVDFELRDEHLNRDLIVLFGGTREVARETIDSSKLTLRLPLGLYKAQVEGTNAVAQFEVPQDAPVIL